MAAEMGIETWPLTQAGHYLFATQETRKKRRGILATVRSFQMVLVSAISGQLIPGRPRRYLCQSQPNPTIQSENRRYRPV